MPHYNRRADLVCFVNGLPLVFIELKAVYRNIRGEFDHNLTDYLSEHSIAHGFHHNAFLVVSNGDAARYGSITSKWEHFVEWKRNAETDNLDGVKNHFKAIHAPFGLLSEDVWAHMAQHGAKRIAEGEYRLHYDPRIGEGLRQKLQGPADLWHVWDAVRCAVRVLRGTESDVLTHAAALQMARRGPRADLVEFSGIGHVPALTTQDQIAAIREWLLAD